MKTITNLFLTLIAASLILLMASCKNEAAAVVDPAGTGTTGGTVTSGGTGGTGTGTAGATWKVSLFIDNGNETADFNGYTFTFNTNGQVSAVKGSLAKTGIWSETTTLFQLDFGADALFDDLGGNWIIVEKTATSIKLKDDNPSSNERLEFMKL